MANNLCIDIEALGNCYNLISNLWTDINLHTVSHIEHLIHLLPVSTALFVNHLEEWWNREHIILDNLAVVAYEVENLCLSTTSTMYHTIP